MNKEELIEKLDQLQYDFEKDPEVIELMDKLYQKFITMFDETFTSEETESSEFDEMSEEYYYAVRENDPDDASIFQVMWFK